MGHGYGVQEGLCTDRTWSTEGAVVCDQMGLACLGESYCRKEFVAELGIGACFAGAGVCVVPLGTG